MSDELKPKHGEWWLGKWSGTSYSAVMQYNGDTGGWHEHGVEASETEHSFNPVERLYVKRTTDRLEQEKAELRKQLKDSHEWLGINADYWGTPLCVNNENLLNK